MPENTKDHLIGKTPGVTNNDDEREGHSGGQHSRDKAHQTRSEAGRRTHENVQPHARQHNEKKEIAKE